MTPRELKDALTKIAVREAHEGLAVVVIVAAQDGGDVDINLGATVDGTTTIALLEAAGELARTHMAPRHDA